MSRLVVITGAARGLGRTMAETQVRAGDRVVLADIRAAELRETEDYLRGIGGDVIACEVDISNEESVAQLATRCRTSGGIDALVNNAALADSVGGKNFWEIELADFERVLRVNTLGTWLVAKHLAPQMLERGRGAVVNLASDAAIYGSPRLSHYITSKGGVMALTRGMARELGPHNIRVNAVAPGLTRIEATEGVPAERYALYADHRVLEREQTPQDVADVVAFLLSDQAAYISGQILPVDGGFVMPQ